MLTHYCGHHTPQSLRDSTLSLRGAAVFQYFFLRRVQVTANKPEGLAEHRPG